MRTTSASFASLRMAFSFAQSLVNNLPLDKHDKGTEVLTFMRQYGYECQTAAETEPQYQLGPWIFKEGVPGNAHEGVGIVCFKSNDEVPAKFGTKISPLTGGAFYVREQIIALFHADDWSIPELAIILLHEGCHARHCLGPKLAGLPPLDPGGDDTHETSTTIFTMNLFATWAGGKWGDVIKDELEWLQQQRPQKNSSEQIVYLASEKYWPSMTGLFGHTTNDAVRKSRQCWVALMANVIYWSHKLPTHSEGQVCHMLVSQI